MERFDFFPTFWMDIQQKVKKYLNLFVFVLYLFVYVFVFVFAFLLVFVFVVHARWDKFEGWLLP